MVKAKKKKFEFRFSRKVFSYPYLVFMLIFVVLPLVLILVNAFFANGQITFDNFAKFFSNSHGLKVLGDSLITGFVTTLLCLLLGYPVAYLLVKYHAGSKVLVLLFILPMWINFLIRTMSTKAIFEALGVQLGMGTVMFGMVYNFLPFMILPLHTALVSIDKSYIEAAQDLGADPVTVFLKTILPLSVGGIVSGVTMVFIPAISTFAITEILSNSTFPLFGDIIHEHFTNSGADFGVGSVMSLVMLVFVILSNLVMNKVNKDNYARSVL